MRLEGTVSLGKREVSSDVGAAIYRHTSSMGSLANRVCSDAFLYAIRLCDNHPPTKRDWWFEKTSSKHKPHDHKKSMLRGSLPCDFRIQNISPFHEKLYRVNQREDRQT